MPEATDLPPLPPLYRARHAIAERTGKPTVLMIGPLPPPWGGQSALMQEILSGADDAGVSYRVLNVAHRRPRLVLRIFYTLRYVLQLSAMLFARPGVAALHIHSSATVAMLEKGLFVLIGRLSGKKVILHVHGGRMRQLWDRSNRPVRSALCWMLGLTDALIVLSDHWPEFYRNSLGYRQPIFVLPNAVRTPSSVPSAPVSSDTVTCLYLGHIKAAKGLLDLLEAFTRLSREFGSRLRLRLVGEPDSPGHGREVRRAYEQAALPNVEFAGLLTGEAKWRALAAADIFVLPSHSEDLPVAMLEAMAMGLPVVATRVGAVPGVLADGEQGFLVEPRAPDELAARLRRLIEDPDLRRRMGGRNRDQVAQHFSFDAYMRQLGAIYARVLA